MRVILHGPVTADHLADAELMAGITPTSFVTNGLSEPPRGNRKELWIAHWATIDGETPFEDAVCGTQKAVEAFDKFFSEPTHG